MKKQIVYALSLGALLQVSAGFADNNFMQRSKECIIKAAYGTKDFCVTGCAKSAEFIRRAPGGNVALDNWKKASLLIALGTYSAVEYGYYKKYSKHTSFWNMVAGILNRAGAGLGNFWSGLKARLPQCNRAKQQQAALQQQQSQSQQTEQSSTDNVSVEQAAAASATAQDSTAQ